MPIADEEITNLEQAKRYFISMGCNHFHLDRENLQRAKEYSSFKISTETESEWRREEFDRQLTSFDTTNSNNVGLSFYGLASIIESNNYYLQRLIDLILIIKNEIHSDQINYVLIRIIGNNSIKTHGGLIQKSYDLKRHDLVDRYISLALELIEKAEKDFIEIRFLQGYLAEIIEHYNLPEYNKIATKLRQTDDEQNFRYYEEGATEGNKFSMNMLAKYYREGKGCIADISKAEFWQQKAKE